MDLPQNGSSKNKKQLSIILATFNESQNILKMLNSIDNVLSSYVDSEIIVVDDNSPDGTGTIVENYIKTKKNENQAIRIIRRIDKRGLSSAIIEGFNSTKRPSYCFTSFYKSRSNNYGIVIILHLI